MIRRDRRPLPIQVRDGVRALIDDLGLEAGDQVPTENEIAQKFDVGRTTVREALKLLEQDGLIDVQHGLGRFVSALPTLRRPITRLESVTEMMRDLGYVVTNRLLSVRETQADHAQADALGISAGDAVIVLERLRLQRDDPLIYSVDVMPRSVVAGSLDSVPWTGSLLEWLDSTDHRVVSATAEMKAVKLPRAIASRIGVGGSQPWLLMIHRNMTSTGEPAIYSHDYYRGDKFTFNVVRRRTDLPPSRSTEVAH